MNSNEGRRFLRSPTGRLAGDGMISDDYGDESDSQCVRFTKPVYVRFPNDGIAPETLNGPVEVIQEGNKKEDENA